ncbi:MAG: cysteine--tRNA ligase [Deltaproteobacteria bacterium]|nr:cysteine--tRNA ligase [Deltaproteobacteria bacterium]
MNLTLFNTLTRQKEVFVPLVPGRVSLYTCGPTVYADAHIGNLRSYVFPDVLRKTLARLGYQVTQVLNITDVGHLTSDADQGEDKMEAAAAKRGESAWEIAERYTERFLTDLDRLGIARPDVMPKATGHIAEQIRLIERLEEKGFTYRAEDGVYFDTEQFPEYGQLARLDKDGLREGARVDMGAKRHKTDFALWKFSPAGAQRQMEWDSPWGRGFPGWHIECSAMAMKYLGETFDIHTGGKDHIPVHHTNEIAQSEGATGRPYVRYWLHGEFLVLGGESDPEQAARMGKSEGNFLRLQEVVERGFDPLAYRYLVLNSHYRKFLHFSWEALKGAETALLGLRRLVRQALDDLGQMGNQGESLPTGLPAAGSVQHELLADLCDDLNTPKALATLHVALKNPSVSAQERADLARFADSLLSLGLMDFSRLADVQAPPEVEELARQRWAARQAKNWGESDRLRDELQERGWLVKDSKEGYTLEPVKG